MHLSLIIPKIQEAHDQDSLLHAGDGFTAGEHLALNQVEVHLLERPSGDGLDVVVHQQVHDGPGQVLARGHAGHPRQPTRQVGEAFKDRLEKRDQIHEPR